MPSAFKLSDVILSVIMPSAIKLSDVILGLECLYAECVIPSVVM